MGRYLSTSIVYGYDLGGREDGWTFTDYDEENWRYNWPQWMELDQGEDDDPEDPITRMGDRLTEVIGGFEDSGDWCSPDPAVSKAYYDRKHAAEKAHGIKFDMYGVSEWSGWVMGIIVSESHDALSEVNAGFLTDDLPWAEYDAKLAKALEALEITPKDQPQPKLYCLVSYF